ncbi:MAG: hypothetical protein AAF125_08910 [Chloroflexota bacterium]
MARRNKRELLGGAGLDFDANVDSGAGTLQDADEFIFGGENASVASKTSDDDWMNQLSSQGLKRTLKAAGGMIQRKDFVMTMQGLEYTGEELTLDEWKEMGEWLTKLRDSIQWMIGDWANLGEQHMHQWMDTETYQRIVATTSDQNVDIPSGKYRWLADVVDYKYGTLRNFAYIAYVFPVSRRRDTLTYSHHVEVAALDSVAKQERLLDRAENNGKRISVRDLRELVQQEMGLLKAPPAKSTDSSPIYRSLIRLQQELTPDRWHQMSIDERQQIHNDLKATLLQIEEMGLD